MFINAYEFEITRNNETIPVSLRLNVAGQMALKKKFNESTTETLFNAIDDIERLVEVLNHSLKYAGNENTVKDGAELLDLMAVNGLLGMAEKQELVTSIGVASGVFSAKEKTAIDSRANRAFGTLLDTEDDSKN